MIIVLLFYNCVSWVRQLERKKDEETSSHLFVEYYFACLSRLATFRFLSSLEPISSSDFFSECKQVLSSSFSSISTHLFSLNSRIAWYTWYIFHMSFVFILQMDIIHESYWKRIVLLFNFETVWIVKWTDFFFSMRKKRKEFWNKKSRCLKLLPIDFAFVEQNLFPHFGRDLWAKIVGKKRL